MVLHWIGSAHLRSQLLGIRRKVERTHNQLHAHAAANESNFGMRIHAAMMHFVLKSPNRVLIVIISRPNKIPAHKNIKDMTLPGRAMPICLVVLIQRRPSGFGVKLRTLKQSNQSLKKKTTKDFKSSSPQEGLLFNVCWKQAM